MAVHELKTWPKFYAAVASGAKTFECRWNDRNFQVGDVLVLREFNPVMEDYTGDECRREVTYVLDNFIGLKPDYCVLGMKPTVETKVAPSPSVMDRLVTVCGVCETAACWQGSFMCDHAEMAGIKNLTVRDLHEKPRGENAEYWFKDTSTGEIDRTLLEIYRRLTSGEKQ